MVKSKFNNDVMDMMTTSDNGNKNSNLPVDLLDDEVANAVMMIKTIGLVGWGFRCRNCRWNYKSLSLGKISMLMLMMLSNSRVYMYCTSITAVR